MKFFRTSHLWFFCDVMEEIGDSIKLVGVYCRFDSTMRDPFRVVVSPNFFKEPEIWIHRPVDWVCIDVPDTDDPFSYVMSRGLLYFNTGWK